MKQTTQTERQAYISKWRSSGLSRPAYSHQAGLKYSTFLSWFKQSGSESDSGRFVALKEKPAQGGDFSITFPNGIRVDCQGQLSKSLVEVLHHV